MIPNKEIPTRKDTRKESRYTPFDAYKSSSRAERDLFGHNNLEFNERLGDLFSLAILEDNLYMLSEEQHKIFRRYLDQANGTLDDDLQQLDKFLGSL